SRRRHTRFSRDWSSDVCSSDLRPFQGDGALSTLYLILEQEVASPCESVANYPEGLARIVLKALNKRAEDRYQSAEAMQKDLEAWLIAQGARVGESDVAALVLSSLGDTIRARNELIELAIERFDSEDVSLDASDAAGSGEDRISESGAPAVSTGSRPRGGSRAGA